MENDFLNLRCGWRVALLYGIMRVHSCFIFFFFFFLSCNSQDKTSKQNMH